MISRFKYIPSVDTRERMEKLASFKISKTLRCKVSFIILSSTGFVVHNKPWNLIFFAKFSCKKHAKTVKITIYPYARPLAADASFKIQIPFFLSKKNHRSAKLKTK